MKRKPLRRKHHVKQQPVLTTVGAASARGLGLAGIVNLGIPELVEYIVVSGGGGGGGASTYDVGINSGGGGGAGGLRSSMLEGMSGGGNYPTGPSGDRSRAAPYFSQAPAIPTSSISSPSPLNYTGYGPNGVHPSEPRGSAPEDRMVITPDVVYSIVVGGGGVGGRRYINDNYQAIDNTSGNNSEIKYQSNSTLIVATTGGGRAGGHTSGPGSKGGSGGGKGSPGIDPVSDPDGYSASGGSFGIAGEGSGGGPNSSSNGSGGGGAVGEGTPNVGGRALATSITGTPINLAGGGGAGAGTNPNPANPYRWRGGPAGSDPGTDSGGMGGTGSPAPAGGSNADGIPGTANTGGGGGGGGGGGPPSNIGQAGSGASGVVYIRTSKYNSLATTTGSPEITEVGQTRVYKFTGDGTITWSSS